jgi:hypothetical protein
MTKPTHSPAPWTAQNAKFGEGITDIVDTRGYVVAVVCGGIEDAEEAGNAAVLRAAPELLRAVQALCVTIERSAPTLVRTMEYAHAQAVLAAVNDPKVAS